MASTPSDLINLTECVSVNYKGSVEQQALSSILGFDVPLDDGVESAAGKFTEKLALKSGPVCSFCHYQGSNPRGSPILIRIGGGLAKGGLGGFQMAQLMAKVNVIKSLT